MLFERRFWPGIADGSITVTFRRWTKPQASAGRPNRTPAGIVLVEAVDAVLEEEVDDAEARAAGYPSADELRADLRGEPGTPLYRIRFALDPGDDPRAVLAGAAELSADDLASLQGRLAKMDAAAPEPWTLAILRLIAENPGRRAGDLAPQLGRELLSFKTDVRKLKNLGLTISLEVGYRLSPRGEAFLRAIGVHSAAAGSATISP